MPLNTAAANAIGADIASALDALPKGEDVTVDTWKLVVGKIFAGIVANGVVTIPPAAIASTVATTGSAAAQTGTGTGPAAPVQLSIT